MIGNNMRGFSLIEIIVAMTVFSLAVGAILSVFTMALRGQRNIFAQQNLADNTRFALEYMSRQIRMAQRDDTGVCTGSVKSTFSSGGASLKFIDYHNKCVTFDIFLGRIRISSGLDQSFLTPDDIVINQADFEVRGRMAEDMEQPRITIALRAQDQNLKTGEILLETTISTRNIDVP